MRHCAAIVLFFSLLTAETCSYAVPIVYQLKFTVETGNVGHQVRQASGTTFSQTSAVGNVYLGQFGVDSQALATDGINQSHELLFLSIRMENNVWAFNAPSNNSFVGFRGPKPGEACTGCMGALSPGLDVTGGEIANLGGGVHGAGDIPFIDFSFAGPHTFNARGRAVGNALGVPYDFVAGIRGRMEVFRIAEPATLLLLSSGLLGLGLARRWSRTA